jgi:outer membrane protein TolC
MLFLRYIHFSLKKINMTKSKQFFLLALLLNTTCIFSQEQLKLTDAIALGLKNNYDILIEQNNAAVAANNNSLGNAGMLPKVDLNASVNFANNATKQEFSSGLVVDKSGVQSNNVNSGVYLSWTLFDGFRMFAAHGRLKELEAMGMLSAKIQIETTVAAIINSYYDVVRQKQLIKGITESRNISEERMKIAQKRLDIGSGSKLDVLQAKVDMNAQTSSLFREKTNLETLKASLNRILSRPVETAFDVEDTIETFAEITYADLKTTVFSKNSALLYAQRNISVYDQLVRESRSLYYPKLNLNANYLFTRSENQAGFSLLNQNLGLNVGLTASWTIFNGFNSRNQVSNAKLQLLNAKYEHDAAKALVEADLFAAFRKHQDDKEILSLEEDNLKLAKEAVDIALERFRIGSSNSLELKEVQKSYEDALVRLSQARYNAKVTETALMQLNGSILK